MPAQHNKTPILSWLDSDSEEADRREREGYDIQQSSSELLGLGTVISAHPVMLEPGSSVSGGPHREARDCFTPWNKFGVCICCFI